MKKILLLILLLIICTSLSAASYQPKVQTHFGLNLIQDINDPNLRTSITTGFSIQPYVINFNNNIPFFELGINTVSDSSIENFTIYQERISFHAALGYERIFTNLFSLSFDLGAGMGFVPTKDLLYTFVLGNIDFNFYLNEYIALTLKTGVQYSNMRLDYQAALALTYRLLGV